MTQGKYFPWVIKNRGLCCAPQIFPAAACLAPPCYTRPKGTPKDGNPPQGLAGADAGGGPAR